MTYADLNGSVRNDFLTVPSRTPTNGSVSEFDQSSLGTVTTTGATRSKGVKNTSSPSCKTGYLRNINLFVFCLSLAFLVRGAMLQYSEDILTHIGKRYPIDSRELGFVIGCERIGFVLTLLFVAFFGNRIHKPIAISIGLFLCALASILMAVPFFISGPRLYEGRISQFATAGLCKQANRNVSFQTQCDLIFYKEDDGSKTFSIICFAKFLVGVGGALYASLGIVYIDEASKLPSVPLYLGSVLSMHGVGRFAGNLLAAWFTSLPEAMNVEGSLRLQQTLAVYDQERVGRWWLAYPIFFSFFLCLSLLTFWFPKYLIIPDWIIRRKARRAKLQAEYDRKLKMKIRAASAKKASETDKKRRKRKKSGNKVGEKSKGDGIEEQEGGGETLGVINEIDPTADEYIEEPIGEEGEEEDETPGKKQQANGGENGHTNGKGPYPSLDNHGFESVPGEGDSSPGEGEPPEGDDPPGEREPPGEGDTPDNTSLEVNMEETGERIKDFEGQDVKENNGLSSKVSAEEQLSVKSAASSSPRKRNTSSSPRKRYQKSPSTMPAYRRKRIRIRKEQLKDLPQSLWKLLNNIRVVIIMLGAILGGFFFNGYLATLPEYIHVQFERSWTTSIILAGVTGHLAWGLGSLIGAILMYRYRNEGLSKVTLAVVACILVSCALTTINMAFHCARDTRPDEASIETCGVNCECDSYEVQYEPLCGPDGKTYPSPCHAGCKTIQLTQTPGVFNFTGCSCVTGGWAMQGACVPQCSQLGGYAVVTFLAVFVASVGIVPVFILLFRSVRSRSRSLAAGFTIWGVYTISQTLGPVVFRYVRSGRCLLWGQDCLEDRVCWRYDLSPYRYIVNGLAAAFLFGSAIPFLLVYWRLKKEPPKKSGSRPASTENRESGDALSGNEQSTQTADVQLYVINEKPTTEDENDNSTTETTSQHI